MGPLGWAWVGITVLLFLGVAWRRRLRKTPEDVLLEKIEKAVVLRPFAWEKPPLARVAATTPPWQNSALGKWKQAGFLHAGDWTSFDRPFFWVRMLVSPDGRSVLLWVNQEEGDQVFKTIHTHAEIFSFEERGGFFLTAMHTDGAAALLTGANRPPKERFRLKLQGVQDEASMKALWEEHIAWIAELETQGVVFQKLDVEKALRLTALAIGGER